ncbi:hypothetical protein CHO01_11280 [Cellulomonas hominis]|uniref:Putative PurR-regulated permease PerM n=1 Tax=Cellulomonas hominis TaxID=156981 RepID=A0A511F9T8_9CELL|nr:hypothetical protein [Cellulomonas hominis]MBB5473525.1 putative PurR-regulated permease PerM [Cellulomonas hominis]NKY06669.1 hypothetical protein [Cellulomonas hominis]NKY10573.1 hypothetical protein [Cellulomonas hominis]GEL46012.1 hypothetical protein CHO01_11280 [Cellulomonas hominis]
MIDSRRGRWFPTLVTFVSFWFLVGALALANWSTTLTRILVSAVLALALGQVAWRLQQRSRRRRTI